MKKHSKSAEETKAYARELLKAYPEVQYWLLHGELGSGKTTFVKGLAAALGYQEEKVKSPTFNMVEDHGDFLHVDLYRLTTPDALIEEELEEHAGTGKKIIMEWPERLSKKPQKNSVELYFTYKGGDERTIELVLH